MKRDALSHHVLAECKRAGLEGRDVLVASSGGLDSMALLELLWSWRRRLKVNLAVAHVHHGPSALKKSLVFRRRALRLVHDFCQERGLTLFTNVTAPFSGPIRFLEPEPPSKSRSLSEADLREFRWGWLTRWRNDFGVDALVVTAHHADDLIETRLLRLIRGTGLAGLKAMTLRDGLIARPLLGLNHSEILHWAQARSLRWVEDPSNKNVKFLRNWLRHRWLRDLERRQPGATKALARSLDLVSESLVPTPSVIERSGLETDGLRRLPLAARSQRIRDYLLQIGVRGFTRRHVEEILKRLDKDLTGHTFSLLGWTWHLDQGRIWASRDELG